MASVLGLQPATEWNISIICGKLTTISEQLQKARGAPDEIDSLVRTILSLHAGIKDNSHSHLDIRTACASLRDINALDVNETIKTVNSVIKILNLIDKSNSSGLSIYPGNNSSTTSSSSGLQLPNLNIPDFSAKQIAIQQDQHITAFNTQLQKCETNELRTCMDSRFLEFSVSNWSKQRTDVGIFTKPESLWGYDFWLKVVKNANEDIGLYLCAGMFDRRDEEFVPMKISYKMLAKALDSGKSVCESRKFTAHFGNNKAGGELRAWGSNEFTNLSKLKEGGAYNPAKDQITFGCYIYADQPESPAWGRS